MGNSVIEAQEELLYQWSLELEKCKDPLYFAEHYVFKRPLRDIEKWAMKDYYQNYYQSAKEVPTLLR